jgi:hypothetical protein
MTSKDDIKGLVSSFVHGEGEGGSAAYFMTEYFMSNSPPLSIFSLADVRQVKGRRIVYHRGDIEQSNDAARLFPSYSIDAL